MNRYPPSRPNNIIHDDSSSLYALQIKQQHQSQVDRRPQQNQPSNNIPTYPASPHQLDELAAASIYLIRNNNNTTAATNTAAKMADTTGTGTSLYKKMMGEESNNIQPKSPEELANSHRNGDSDDDTPEEIYHDYAQEEDPTEKIKGEYAGHSSLIEHEDETTRNLANQKLPAKLAAMLSDPDLITCITWLPHGRSWKILNRDLFSTYALPRYFGHSNHSSFVRVVNAWGFRRVVSGPDRDSYYHELFLRGKPCLFSRMKRLPNNAAALANGGRSRRKGNKVHAEMTLDFYAMSKKSPLPENTWQYKPQTMNNGGAGGRGGGMMVGGHHHPHHHPGSLGAFGPPGSHHAHGHGGMMGGMAGVPPGAMGMHHHHGSSMGGVYPPMPGMVRGGGSLGPTNVVGGGWNAPGGSGGGSGGAAAAGGGMMRMPRHRRPSFDGPSSTAGGAHIMPRGPPDVRSEVVHRSSSTQGSPQSMVRQQPPPPKENSSNNSAEVQSLMNQNQLLKALLKKTQAALSAAAAGGGGAVGGGGYPTQHYSERGSAAADGGNNDD